MNALQPVPARRRSTPPSSLAGQAGLPVFATMAEAASAMGQDRVVSVLHIDEISATAKQFLSGFPGRILYAVKANPNEAVLQTLWHAGVRCFDVASEAEVRLIHNLFPEAIQYFMHPVKSRGAIRAAYELGVRHFSLDSMEELNKIVEETGGARDLHLHVRLAVNGEWAAYDLSGKFGVPVAQADQLLLAVRDAAARVGVTFHVGSQCQDPLAYARALDLVAGLVKQVGVRLDSVDVGGGFPVAYPGMLPPSFDAYFEVIRTALEANGFGDLEVMAEPGRALVALGGATLVRVMHRRGNMLFINDGTYGSLFDAGTPGWKYPVEAISGDGRTLSEELTGFGFFGPTCDSLDVMKGPFFLPDNIGEGDWIEIAHTGAYGQAMTTRFNGFDATLTAAVLEAPLTRRVGSAGPRFVAA